MIKKVSELPVQVSPLLVKEGVAITVAVWGDEPVLVTVNEGILPLPLAANPMLVLLLVQLNAVFITELVKFIAVVWVLWHKVWSEVAAISGIGFTLTVIVVVAVQPSVFVPVTVYVVELLGVTVILDPVIPLLHEYVLAPLVLNIEFDPWQIKDGLALAVITNNGGWLIVTLFESMHPLLSVTVIK